MSEITAVTFDLWNTLMRDDPAGSAARGDRRVALVQSFFAAGDRKVLSEPVRWALEKLADRVNFMRQSEQAHPAADEIGHIVASQLGFELSLDDAATLAGVISMAGAEHPPELIDGAADLLASLHGRVAIGIVSDTVLTGGKHMEMALEARGVAGLIDHCTWSDQTLTTKPQARQFLHALYVLGVTDPATAVHVGDLETADVIGAKSIGMKTIRVVAAGEDAARIRAASAADAVAADMAEVGRILELWM